MDLFSSIEEKQAPLADRMRPKSLDQFIGQEHIIGQGKLLSRAILTNTLTSSIFFGPPGSGKTTLASIIATQTQSRFEKLNAVSDGVKEVREVIKQAETNVKLYNQSTYLLLDECHRWSKSQSDSILPALEKGTIKFIGSTTENPMIAMTAAIVSRCRIFEFKPLSCEQVVVALEKALKDQQYGYGKRKIIISQKSISHIANAANGDIRVALNALELAVLGTPIDQNDEVHVTLEIAQQCVQTKILAMDDEQFYNMLSAFCKSMRGSNSDAALAWFARMIYAGVDPRIVVRRMIVHASEDIGLANPNALVQAVNAMKALEFIGMPEARIPIAQAIIYICESPKSNSVIVAISKAFQDAKDNSKNIVPLHLRDSSYSGAQKLGNAVEYKYPHDFPNHFVEQNYMPQSVSESKNFNNIASDDNTKYYVPTKQGHELKIFESKKQRESK